MRVVSGTRDRTSTQHSSTYLQQEVFRRNCAARVSVLIDALVRTYGRAAGFVTEINRKEMDQITSRAKYILLYI